MHNQRARQRRWPAISKAIGACIGRSRALNKRDKNIGLGVGEAIRARIGHTHALDGESAVLALALERKSTLASDIRALSTGAIAALALASARRLALASSTRRRLRTRKVDAVFVIVVVVVVVGGGVGVGGGAAAARLICCRVHGRRRDRHLL